VTHESDHGLSVLPKDAGEAHCGLRGQDFEMVLLAGDVCYSPDLWS